MRSVWVRPQTSGVSCPFPMHFKKPDGKIVIKQYFLMKLNPFLVTGLSKDLIIMKFISQKIKNYAARVVPLNINKRKVFKAFILRYMTKDFMK